MIDYHKELVSALKSVLPVHYEMTLTKGTATPCITYTEINNYVERNGDTLVYGRVTFQVKVWANNMSDIQKYSLQIDDVLRPLGFTRTNSNELCDFNSTMIQKVMTFHGLYIEQFN